MTSTNTSSSQFEIIFTETKTLDLFWNVQYNITVLYTRSKIARTKAFDRQKALIKALQVFWRKGYAATSVEDLVKALHLSRSSLYDTFGDKRTLFLEALKLYSESVIRRIAQTLTDSSSALVGIQTLLDDLTAGVGNDAGAMGCFMVNSVAELVPYDSDVTKIAAAYSNSIQKLLAEKLQDTNTGKHSPAQLAAYVFNAMQGMRILIKSGATKEQVQAICTMTLRNL